MTDYDEERLAELLRSLPPAPADWVAAAKELPGWRAEIGGIIERAERDEAFRGIVLADLEAAVRTAGLEPTPSVLDHLRRHLRA